MRSTGSRVSGLSRSQQEVREPGGSDQPRIKSQFNSAEPTYLSHKRNWSKNLGQGQVTAKSVQDDEASNKVTQNHSSTPSRENTLDTKSQQKVITSQENSSIDNLNYSCITKQDISEQKNNTAPNIERKGIMRKEKHERTVENRKVNDNYTREDDSKTNVTSNKEQEVPTIKRKELFVCNPIRRSAKSRKSIKRNSRYLQYGKTGPNSATSEEKQEEDPLSFIEIKSAAQWKSISHCVSWKFDEKEEEDKKDENDESSSKIRSRAPPIQQPNTEITINPPNLLEYPAMLEQTTLAQLRNICWRIKPWNEKKDSRLFTSLYGRGWGVDCDEVVKGLFIGDKAAITNVGFLKKQGITSVLNVAEGRDEGKCCARYDHG